MQPPDIWSDVFAILLAETDVRLRAVYAFLGAVLSTNVSVMQGVEIMGGGKEKDSAEELFSYGPPLNLLLYIICVSVKLCL